MNRGLILPSLTVLALGLLAGCDQPKQRTPAPPAGPAAATAQKPVWPPPPKVDPGPLPAMPAWAGDFLGKPVASVVTDTTAKCLGNTDIVDTKYTGAPPGVQIEGWGWDPTGKDVVKRIVIADSTGQIVGAGETGKARPDVSSAHADITSGTTGWTALIKITSGGVDTYGLLGGGKACRLGHLQL